MTHMPPLVVGSFQFGRQSILDNRFEVLGYELLYRPIDELDRAISGDIATARVISSVITESDLSIIKASKQFIFINMTKEHLMNIDFLQLPTNLVVYEILEDVIVDEHLIDRLRLLKAKGYRFALDDFTLNKYNKQLIPLVSYIKLDVQFFSAEQLSDHVQYLKRYAPPSIKLIAEKIETAEELHYCQELGFDYYQGFLFEKPALITGKALLPSRANLIKLQNRLMDPNASSKEIASKLEKDPILVYKLLKFVGQTDKANTHGSILSVVEDLGHSKLGIILQLFALSHTRGPTDLTIREILSKAYKCKRIAEENGLDNPHQFYLAGMFRQLEQYLNLPMATLLKQLPLKSTIKRSLRELQGDFKEVLGAVDSLDYYGPDRYPPTSDFMESAIDLNRKNNEHIQLICNYLNDRIDQR